MPRFAVGHRFPEQTVHLAPARVRQYLAAVAEENPLYRAGNAAPPLAVAAWALAGLIDAIGLPPGSVHASQEFTFMAAAPVGSSLNAAAEVVQAGTRGGMDVIVVEIRVAHAEQPVLSGRSMLMMPAS